MADKGPKETDAQRRARLFNELLENIDRQLDIDRKLKEHMEYLFNNAAKSAAGERTPARVADIRDLYIEAESLQAEGRAIFHRLFGTHLED